MAKARNIEPTMGQYKFKSKLDYRAATGKKVEGGVIVGTPIGKFTTNPNGKKNVARGVEEDLKYPTQEQFQELYAKYPEMRSMIDAPEAENE